MSRRWRSHRWMEPSMEESPIEDSDVHGWNVTDEGSPIPGESSTDGASLMEEHRILFC
jgi:hypothetical protein